MTEKIILTLTKHPLWGHILQPILVEENEYGTMTILEFADSKSSGFSQLNDLSKEIILLSEKMSDMALITNFSKEKTIAAFHKKVKPEIIEQSIRPYIEEYQHKIILLLNDSKLPLYLRENTKIRNLYDTDQVMVSNSFSKVIFSFTKDEDLGIRYSIRVKWEDEEFNIYAKTHYNLCSEPAALVMNKKLFIFDNIDLKKLNPFFSKQEIEIPLSYESTYIKTYIRNCVENHEVITQGFDICEKSTHKKAALILETDSNNMPILNLNILYENVEYPLDNTSKRIVQVEEQDGKTSLTWFNIDKAWEKSLVGMLLKSGLEKVGPQQFSHRKNKSEVLVANQIKNMVDWINLHTELLKHFEFNQDLPA